MPSTPRVPHKQAGTPNTDLQSKIIKAVEELYPEWNMGDIARLHTGEDGLWHKLTEDQKERLEEIDTHQTTVSKTISKYMAPEDEFRDDGGNGVGGRGNNGIEIPEGVDPETYFRSGFVGLSDIVG